MLVTISHSITARTYDRIAGSRGEILQVVDLIGNLKEISKVKLRRKNNYWQYR